ncbi:MAG: arginine--tRNA ligase, partial [Saprospiraceae bacterium]
MSNIVDTLKENVAKAVQELYGGSFEANQIKISPTRKGVEGDYTVLVFPFSKVARKKPEVIGEEIGNYLVANLDSVSKFEISKGFLNLFVSDNIWGSILNNIYAQPNFGTQPANGEKVMVEYSSPNTNKPLHLGHIRNNLLGWSTAKVLTAAGYDVTKVQIVNDRGVHICKSMLAWQKYGNGATPESTGQKGDHLIGHYYVLFEKEFQKEYAVWQATEAAQEKYKTWLESEAGQKETKEKGSSDLSSHFFKSVYKNKYFNTESVIGGEA